MTPRIEPKPARDLTSGAWTARWDIWLIEMRLQRTGWRARVYEWPQGQRGKRLDEVVGVASPEDAAKWACRVLSSMGAKVIIDGHHRPIVDYLAFTPAPMLEIQVNE